MKPFDDEFMALWYILTDPFEEEESESTSAGEESNEPSEQSQ